MKKGGKKDMEEKQVGKEKKKRERKKKKTDKKEQRKSRGVDPVGSGFIWVRGSGSGSRGLTNNIFSLFFTGNYIFQV